MRGVLDGTQEVGAGHTLAYPRLVDISGMPELRISVLMNTPYRYVGQSLTPRMAQEIIIELFAGQLVSRQAIIERVDQVHLERGGHPAAAMTPPVVRALSAMKTAKLAENPRRSFWSIASSSIAGRAVVSVPSETTESQQIKTLDAFVKWAAQFETEENDAKYLFRGVPNSDYDIDASAYRRVKKGRDGDESLDEEFQRFLQLNKDMINDARFRRHDRRNERELADLEILAEFQHYGAATCLIDFTYNPLVALWFACKPEIDTDSASPIDGKVVAVCPNDFTEFREITLKSLKKEIDHFFQDSPNSTRKRLYQWQPWHQNNRIIAQQSAFLFGVLEIHPDPDKTCIIDGGSKKQIRESLKQIYGITEDMLFPDFEGFARQHSQEIPYTQQTVPQYMEKGRRAFQNQEYKVAITEYDMALRRDPDYTEAYYQRGLAKFYSQRHEAAVTDFGIAIDIRPDYAEAYYQRGLVTFHLQAYEAAAEDYDEAIRRGLDTPDVYYNRGNVNARLREYEAAAEDYDEAIQRGLDTPDVYYNRGIMSALLEVYEAALEDYDEAIRRGLDTPDVYYSRGRVLFQLGYFDESEQTLHTALSLARQTGETTLVTEIEQYLRDMNLDGGEDA